MSYVAIVNPAKLNGSATAYGQREDMGSAATGRERLLTLDAMRGVAAAMVVLHHAAPMVIGQELIASGYLAVDFFFMLSGFVITRTFEHRFSPGLRVHTFLLARFRRLYPVMAMGIALGAMVSIAKGTSILSVANLLVSELLFVPALGAGLHGVFRLNGVQWSLFFELVANAAHAVGLHRLRTRPLILLASVALIGLACAGHSWGSIAVGDRGANVVGGIPRVFFPYVVGIILSRSYEGWSLPPMRGGCWAPVTLLVAAVAAPGFTPGLWPHQVIELLVVATVFPVILIAGVSARPSKWQVLWAKKLGSLSYPVYALHVPTISLILFLSRENFVLAFGVAATCFAVVIAYAKRVRFGFASRDTVQPRGENAENASLALLRGHKSNG